MTSFRSKIGRRDLLLGGPAVIGAGFLAANGAAAQEGRPEQPERPRMPFGPKFSMAERDRRWANVRALMNELELDVIVAPHGPTEPQTRNLSYASYLSEGAFLTPGAVVFPAEGDPAIFGVFPMPPMIPRWIEDEGGNNEPLGPGIVGKITDMGAAAGRVGVIGTKAQVFGLNEFVDQGTIMYATYADMQAGLPDAEFVDITEQYALLTLVKGEEELAAAEEAAVLSESLHQMLLDNVRVGTTQADVKVMIAEWFIRNGADTAVEQLNFPFGAQAVAEGAVINSEYDVFVNGGRAQVTLCMAFGAVSDDTQAMSDAADAAMALGLELVKPGAKFGDVTGAMDALIAEAGFYHTYPCIHSLTPTILVGSTGIAGPQAGYDPVLGGDVELQPGMLLSFEPNANKGFGQTVKTGGTAVVTADGVRMMNSIGAKMQVIA